MIQSTFPSLDLSSDDADMIAWTINAGYAPSLTADIAQLSTGNVMNSQLGNNQYTILLEALQSLAALVPAAQQALGYDIQRATSFLQGIQNKVASLIDAQFRAAGNSGNSDSTNNSILSFISQLNTLQSTITSTMTNMTTRVGADVTMLQSAQSTLTQQVQTTVQAFTTMLRAITQQGG